MRPFLLATVEDLKDDSRVGGKAYGLHRLKTLGLEVPLFEVLPVEIYEAVCTEGRVPPRLPAEVEKLLDDVWNRLGEGGCALAVRSSAVGEDSREYSFAGQFDTFLNVDERAALSRAVLGCFKSFESERIRAYRAARTTDGPQQAMAVVIQQMALPTASGVLFTVNPASGRADEILINSVWGLGEGLVSGALDADIFVLNRSPKIISKNIMNKSQQVVIAESGGTEMRPVDDAYACEPSLSEEQLHELTEKSLHAEAQVGRPLDIEFAVTDEGIVYLQARPVTGFKPRAQPEDGGRTVWDNSNINESYPGITLPLTFSFIRRAYHAVYWQFCEVIGLSEHEIRCHDPMLWNMLGLIQGRVYYNLRNWYRLVALLPGFRYNKGFMEAMMGLNQPDDIVFSEPSFFQKYFVELPRLARVGVHGFWLQLTLQRRIRRFHSELALVFDVYSKKEFAAMPPHEALAQFRRLEQKILWRWKAPIINDFAAMISYGLLKRLTVSWSLDPDGALQNALMAGQGHIESADVAGRLTELASRIRNKETLKQRLLDAAPSEVMDIACEDPEIRRLLETYLGDFGDRCVEELKLESKTMRDDPRFLMEMIKNYLRSGEKSVSNSSKQRVSPGTEAERTVDRRLGWKLSKAVIPKRWLYRWVLKNARRAVRNRENQRMERTRAFGLVRRIFRSIGVSFCRLGLIEHSDDVFYLEVEEIERFIEGASSYTDLATAVANRKAQYDRYRALPNLPEHFVTYGAVNVGNPFVEEDPPHSEGTILSGLGAFPGTLEGLAVVMVTPDPSVALDGKVLVTYQTDPGWVVLFPFIGGLVVERGSMLSHSAIVAREMGIPAVVGVRGAVSRIQTGDRLRLDAGRGTVEIIQ